VTGFSAALAAAGLAASAAGDFTAGVAALAVCLAAGFLVSLETVVSVGSFFFGISSVL